MEKNDQVAEQKSKVTIYIGDEDLKVLNMECIKFKDHMGKPLSRNRMIYYIMEQYFKNTTTKEEQSKNGN